MCDKVPSINVLVLVFLAVRKRIDADIERALTARGLMMVTGPANLNVRYRFGSARRTEVESYPAGCPAPRELWSSICAIP